MDLQLRKWISSMLSHQPIGGAANKSAKAELAQRLNHARKTFLTQLKSLSLVEATAGDLMSDVDATVVAHVESFQRQFCDL